MALSLDRFATFDDSAIKSNSEFVYSGMDPGFWGRFGIWPKKVKISETNR